MQNFDWQRLWDMYQRTYFSSVFMFVAALALALYALKARRQRPLAPIIGIYATSSALQAALAWLGEVYIPLRDDKYLDMYYSLIVSLFILIEITCCYLLVALSSPQPRQRLWLRGLLLVFYAFALLYGGWYFTKGYYDDKLTFVQLPLMLVFCGIYYYNLLTGPPQTQLLRQPLFWAVGGMCLAAMVILPFSLVQKVLSASKQLFALSHIIPTACYLTVFFIHFKAIQWSKKVKR